MTENLEGQVSWFDLDIWFGKTSPELSVPTAEKTSKRSSKKSSGSQNRTSPICVQLCRGGWTKSGCVYSEVGDWSIAWRVHDAQFWGVPQRRKRIALVADFGGLSAPEILFERKGLSRNPEPCGTEREGIAERTEGSSGEASEPVRDGLVESEGTYYDPGYRNDDTICLQGNGIDRADTAGCNCAGWRRGGVTPLTPSTGQPFTVPINTMVATRDTPETRTTFGVGEPDDPQFTLSAAHEHAVFTDLYNGNVTGETAVTLNANSGASSNHAGPTVMAAGFSFGQSEKARSLGYQEEMSPTLRGGDGGNQKPVVLSVDCRNFRETPELNGVLQAKESGGYNYNSGYVIRENFSPE